MLGLFLFAAFNILAHQADANGMFGDARDFDEREENYGYYERNYVTDQGIQMICDSMKESYAVACARDNFLKMYGSFGFMYRPNMSRYRTSLHTDTTVFPPEFAIEWLMMAGYVNSRSAAQRILELMIEKGLVRRAQAGMYVFTGKRVQEPPPMYEGPNGEIPAITAGADAVPPSYDEAVVRAAAAGSVSDDSAEADGNDGEGATDDTADEVMYTPITQAEIDGRTANAVASVTTVSSESSAEVGAAPAPAPAPARAAAASAAPQQRQQAQPRAQAQTQQRRAAPERRQEQRQSSGGWWSDLIDTLVEEFSGGSSFGPDPDRGSRGRPTPASGSNRQVARRETEPAAPTALSVDAVLEDASRAERPEEDIVTRLSYGAPRRSTEPNLRLPSYEESATDPTASAQESVATVDEESEAELPPPPPYSG